MTKYDPLKITESLGIAYSDLDIWGHSYATDKIQFKKIKKNKKEPATYTLYCSFPGKKAF